MKHLMIRCTIALLMTVTALPAFAQSAPSTDTELRLEKKPRRIIVHPKPAMDAAAQEADRVTRDIVERQARGDRITRDVTSPSRRPDLDRDVVGGIQTRSLNRLPR